MYNINIYFNKKEIFIWELILDINSARFVHHCTLVKLENLLFAFLSLVSTKILTEHVKLDLETIQHLLSNKVVSKLFTFAESSKDYLLVGIANLTLEDASNWIISR